MQIAYLLLGSNLGDRVKYLTDATNSIALRLGKITKSSSYFETASWGKNNQPDFINQVHALDTELNAYDLLDGILSIELELGRERQERWGSRTIDIDILLFGNQIIDEANLKIPHPFLHERRFSLVPLHEIAPDLLHPIMKLPIKDLLDNLSDDLFVKKLS